jgi:hypothetical protein
LVAGAPDSLDQTINEVAHGSSSKPCVVDVRHASDEDDERSMTSEQAAYEDAYEERMAAEYEIKKAALKERWVKY